MSEPTQLTPDLLETLADRWRAVELPVLARLRPGLSGEEMRAIMEPLGLELPSEARVWWGWHDGATPGEVYARERFIKPGLEFQSLREMVDWYATRRADFAEFDEGVDYFRPPNHFNLFWLDSGDVTFDCASDGPYSPLYYSDFYDGVPEEVFATPVARSIGEMVTWWIEAWDDGAWGPDPETDDWEINFDRIDRSRQLLV